MNNSNINIDKWLLEGASNQALAVSETWEPIFAPDRHLVYIKVGPYWRLFERPEGFVKRFYHHVYALPIEKWQLSTQIDLYEGFCNVVVTLEIHFQAGIKYALNNMAVLSSVNTHIKSTYEDALMSAVQNSVIHLPKNTWVRNGLGEVEKKIASDIGEMFVMQAIQSRVLCELTPTFKEFPDVILSQEDVYLSILKKNFEFNQAKRDEEFRQQAEIENQLREQKQKHIENLEYDARLEREEQATAADNALRLLEEFAMQQAARFDIEKRIHAEKLQHENTLKDMEFDATLALEKKQHAQTLTHTTQLKEEEIKRDIMLFEKEKAQWLDAKNKTPENAHSFSLMEN
ncbi:MAG: hypothetical protein QG557_935 [Pseudomonadota bacterium]|nr:hypothetical protein [Pseudomonadota bacterium]